MIAGIILQKGSLNMRTEERFLKYVSYPTMSDENSDTCPSSSKQLVLGKILLEELKSIGMEARMTDSGYVYGSLEATPGTNAPSIGFIAHMDTSDAVADSEIKPRKVLYDGDDIILKETGSGRTVLSEKDYPRLSLYKGKHLIVTDGTTLLGADDKAGIAEIISAVENIILSGKPHGPVRVAITPDEEIGRGADLFDVNGFKADFAFTVDGGALGELEYENFNAASANVIFHGVSIHPGSAKGKMKNASTMALAFNSMLPQDEVPEKTENYEGFYHLTGMSGSVENATLSYIIRDHDRDLFEKRKKKMSEIASKCNEMFGFGSVTLEMKDSYYNMEQIIRRHPEIIELASEAMKECGVEPVTIPIRGGTDGARLSYMGLPCPNICTGGENFHSRFEYVCTESMEKITEIIEKIITKAVK